MPIIRATRDGWISSIYDFLPLTSNQQDERKPLVTSDDHKGLSLSGRFRKPLFYPTELRRREPNCRAPAGRLEGKRGHFLLFRQPQHPPAKACRCLWAFQQAGQSLIVEWVKSSTDSMRCSTIVPQSEQGSAAVSDRTLCAWVLMSRDLCIGANMLVAYGGHKSACLSGTGQDPQPFRR